MTPLQAWAIVAGGAALALLCLYFAFRLRSRERLLTMLPTVKTQGVFIGFVELQGSAQAPRPLRSYLAEAPCVHYSWEIEEHWSRTVTETYTDKDGRLQTRTRHESGWTTVAEGGEMIPFYLRDDTGVIRIDPDGAKLEPVELFSATCGRGEALYYAKGPPESITDSDHERRFVECGLPVGVELYVAGQSRERQDVVAAEIAHDPRAPLFLISTRSEKQVESGMGWSSWGFVLLALVLVAAGIFIGRREQQDIPVPDLAVGLGLFLAAWVLGWCWMAYNSLVALRQRVRSAASLIDIELKRRHDLIPAVVAAVQGYRDHEATLQKELAALRTQSEATLPGRPGPDPSALLPSLRVIAERYPDLKADASFAALRKSLTETEQRIALARSYFNSIASGYNTCLEVVPDRFLASLGGLQPQPLFAAADFERAVVAVDLQPPP
ncbi:MAG: LemA family protein [Planctomycetaceae bacterium]|nr:LemA family protein [Planctomycetaceae bacterium]